MTTPRATARIIRSVVAGVGTAVIVAVTSAVFALSGAGPVSAAPAPAAAEVQVKPSPKPTKKATSIPTPVLKTITITGPNIARPITIRSDHEASLYSTMLAQVSWMTGQTPDVIKTTPANLGPAYHVVLLTSGVPTAAYDLYPECPGGARAYRPAENSEAKGWFYAPLTMTAALQSAGVVLPNPAAESGFSEPPAPTAEKGATLGQLMHQSRLALALAGGAALIVLITLAAVAWLVRRLDHRRGVPAALTRLDTVAVQDGRMGGNRRGVRPGVPGPPAPLNRPGLESTVPLAGGARPVFRPGTMAPPAVASGGLAGRQAAAAGSGATGAAFRRPGATAGARTGGGPTVPGFRAGASIPPGASTPSSGAAAGAGAPESNDPIRANNRRRWFGLAKRTAGATRPMPEGVDRIVAADPVSAPVPATSATSEPLVVHPPKPAEQMPVHLSTSDTVHIEPAGAVEASSAAASSADDDFTVVASVVGDATDVGATVVVAIDTAVTSDLTADDSGNDAGSGSDDAAEIADRDATVVVAITATEPDAAATEQTADATVVFITPTESDAEAAADQDATVVVAVTPAEPGDVAEEVAEQDATVVVATTSAEPTAATDEAEVQEADATVVVTISAVAAEPDPVAAEEAVTADQAVTAEEAVPATGQDSPVATPVNESASESDVDAAETVIAILGDAAADAEQVTTILGSGAPPAARSTEDGSAPEPTDGAETQLTEAVVDAAMTLVAFPDKPGGPGIVPAARKAGETIAPDSEDDKTDISHKTESSPGPDDATAAAIPAQGSGKASAPGSEAATSAAGEATGSSDSGGTSRRRRSRRVPAARTPQEPAASESATSSAAAPQPDAE